MSANLSHEEFARFQAQLLHTRSLNYQAEEARLRAEALAHRLEETLARQSGELAQVRSQLSRVQHAGDIEAVSRENNGLRQKLINIESSFQLQTATLRAECERLQVENSVLLASLKLSAPPAEEASSSVAHHSVCSFESVVGVVNSSSQTEASLASPTASTQTDASFWKYDETVSRLQSAQQALDSSFESCADLRLQLARTEAELKAVQEASTAERSAWASLQTELVDRTQALEVEVANLREENESLQNRAAVLQRLSSKVQKELRRQLATSLRAPGASNSSLVYLSQSEVSAQNDLQGRDCEVTSMSSFSMSIPNQRSFVAEETSETSSSAGVSAVFSEEDFKSLLNRLAEVQEENCLLRRQMQHLNDDLDAKKHLIQTHLDGKLNPTPSHGASKPVAAPIASSSRLGWEATGLASSQELRRLKQLCEELMTRNILLEKALDQAS